MVYVNGCVYHIMNNISLDKIFDDLQTYICAKMKNRPDFMHHPYHLPAVSDMNTPFSTCFTWPI